MSGLNLPNIFRRKKTVPPSPIPEPIQEEKYVIPKWVTIALTFMGTTEIPGPGSNSKIDEFLESVGMPSDDDIAWCSAFANWIMMEADLPGTGKPNAQSFLHSSNFIKIDEPRLGCIVVLKRGNEPWMGHVGFYLDHHKGYIRLLGGNQANRVGINNYGTDKVMAYLWPKSIPLAA
jgi:uncharacterized protein (TIGR02594 family)